MNSKLTLLKETKLESMQGRVLVIKNSWFKKCRVWYRKQLLFFFMLQYKNTYCITHCQLPLEECTEVRINWRACCLIYEIVYIRFLYHLNWEKTVCFSYQWNEHMSKVVSMCVCTPIYVLIRPVIFINPNSSTH